MSLTPKQIKLLRAKQHKDQNLKNAQEAAIQDLSIKYNLIAPPISDYNELTRWIRLKHRTLSQIKSDRDSKMQGNNRRIEQIIEDIRVNVKQELEHIADDKKNLDIEYANRISVEEAILNAEIERIQEKHKYLISSNRVILNEANNKLNVVNTELNKLIEQQNETTSLINDHKTRNDMRRAQALEITRMRQQAKKDKRCLLEKLRTACKREEDEISAIQSNIDMYPEYRRRINEDYYNWLADVKQTQEDIDVLEAEIDKDELDDIFAASGLTTNINALHTNDDYNGDIDSNMTNNMSMGSGSASTTGSSAIVRKESLDMLKLELSRLQNEDHRQHPDDRYKKLDSDMQTWTKNSVSHKRQLSRLRTELEQAGAICPDAISLENTNKLSIHELENEAKLDKEYQYLKSRRQQLDQSIKTLSEQKKYLEAQVISAQNILNEEKQGLGKQLQEQWNRCHMRWDKMKDRVDKWLSVQKSDIEERKLKIKNRNKELCKEKQNLEKQNAELGDADDRCELNNSKISSALQCLDNLLALL